MNRTRDENDKTLADTLPDDPETGTRMVGKLVAIETKREEDAARLVTVKQMLDVAAATALNEDRATVCTTGHYQLDDATGGICPGDGWVFAADTNWGKSSWLVSVVDENIAIGKRVLIVAVEDDKAVYGRRLLARRSGVNAKDIRSGKLHPDQRERIAATVAKGEDIPVYLDARGKDVEWVVRAVDRLIDKEKVDLVAYDYLQEFTTSEPSENHRLTVKKIAKQLRTVVKLKGKASIIFSQLTAATTGSTKAHPDKDMIRDCRDVANAAEVIILGYTPGKPIESQGRVVVTQGCKAAWIDKVKEGPKHFAVELGWDEDTASFMRIDSPGRAAQARRGETPDPRFPDDERYGR